MPSLLTEAALDCLEQIAQAITLFVARTRDQQQRIQGAQTLPHLPQNTSKRPHATTQTNTIQSTPTGTPQSTRSTTPTPANKPIPPHSPSRDRGECATYNCFNPWYHERPEGRNFQHCLTHCKETYPCHNKPSDRA
jgi:hypothetical protein